ncbi:response regulator [Brevibacterium jeotgali]|nr:response regulator transcription factor [Brevibacterium jeotgali]
MTETQATEPIRVLIVDDESLMRAGLRLMVDDTAGITVVGEAADGPTALSQARVLDPDVVLMDIRMPGMSGIETTAELTRTGARARVVVLTAFDADGFLVEALRAGAVSFLLKESAPEAVIEAIHGAVRGRARFSPSVLDRLVRIASTEASGRAAVPTQAGSGGSAPPAALTPREWDVGRLVAQGLTNAEISDALVLSLPTVKTHVSHLFDKLLVTNRVQLAIRILEHDG